MDSAGPSTAPGAPLQASDTDRIQATFAGQELVPKAAATRQPGMMRTDLVGPVAISAGWFGLTLGPLAGVSLWWLYSRGAFAPPVVIGLGVFAAVFITGLIWLTGVGGTTFGVAIVGDGILIFDRSIRPGKLIKWSLTWSGMRLVNTNPGNIWLAEGVGPGFRGTYLAYDQARAVLSDRRCPLRTQIPKEVRRRLKLAVSQSA